MLLIPTVDEHFPLAGVSFTSGQDKGAKGEGKKTKGAIDWLKVTQC